MAKTYSAIKTVSDQIKNATTAASNTAAIVGGNLGDIVDKIQEVDGAKVPKTTTVNGKPLSGNISLDATDIGIAPDLADKVSKTATETIGGTKTFSVSPIIPTPDADMEAATKKYVDDTKATVDAALLNKADLVGGKIPTSQLPAYVDDVLEYANLAAFPATGETGKIYVALDTNLTYRWSSTAYVEISKSLALGETSSTAYRGDRGKAAYDHSQATGNVHGTTASQIPNTPAGTIAATTVQGAINELAGDIVQVETDLNLKIDKTSVKQVTGESLVDVMSQKAVTDEIAQLESDVIQKPSTLIGDNLFNPNYLPVGEQLWMKGGDGTLIKTISIEANASFYTTPIIEWANANKMIAKRIRSYVQLDELFNPIAFYYPAYEQSNYVITKEVNAKYIKICCDISYKPTNIVNYGETLILYRPYRENKVYNTFSNTEVTDREIIDIKNKINTFNNTAIGNNLFNPYYSPISNDGWAKGGINTLINSIGVTISSAGWYTTSLVEWKENSIMFAKRYRSWVQLNEYMDVIAVDYPAGAVSNQQISKSEGAKYIKISVPWTRMSNLKLEMLNYGSVALAYEEYKEKSINSYTGYDYTDYYLRLKEYIINESFTVPSVTYDANGVVVSPLNVLWADGGTGQLTITRNSNSNITKILATYLKNDVSINMTLNINRDINNNVTSVTF